MSSTIDVKSARIPDRDQLLELLRENGLTAEPRGRARHRGAVG